MKRGRYFTALFLALVLMVGMIVPAQAAGLRLQWTQDGDSVELKLRGLGEESIYGVQLELTVDGTYTGAFTPAAAEAYSPECRVSSSDRRTRVIIYITSQKPLNSGGSLEVGGLTLSGGFTMPASATVTLLSHELKPLTSDNGTKIPASGQVIDGEDSDDEDDESPTYRVRVSSAKNGQVVSDVLEAPARSLVKLTVTPENRYDLMELTVTSARGGKMALTDIGGNRYTFRMPAGDVEVTSQFHWTGITHIPMSFSDVNENHWFHTAVHYVYDMGMMSGTSATTFSPDLDTSRGMLVTILHRMEGSPEAAASTFADVPREAYYAKAVDWASGNGIVSGYGGNEAGTFGPDNGVTREQLATILYRYSEKKGVDMSVRGDMSGFVDRDAISAYAKEAVAWAVGMGLVSGTGEGHITPAGSATRAQVATILMRYQEKVAAAD